MKRSIDNFDRQYKNLAVRKLMVSVPASTGLVERLGGSLDLPVENVRLSEVMDIDDVPELSADDAQVYALHALGAALRAEGREP